MQESGVRREGYRYCCTAAAVPLTDAVLLPFDSSSGALYCLWEGTLSQRCPSTAAFYPRL